MGDLATEDRRRRRRLRVVLLSVAVSLLLVLGAAATGGALLLHGYDRSVARDTLLAPSARAPAPVHHADVRGPLNFLLIGSDYRVANPLNGERSDTIIIAHVPRSLDRVYLISIPRDLRVDIPPSAALDFAGDTTKINAAFDYGHGGRGGTQLLSLTLTTMTGIRFDGAAVVDFTGLRRAVDALGGVRMCVDVRTVSIHTGRVFEVGCRVMRSAEVLDYLRQREYPDGDFTRQRHEQQFLKAVADRALGAGTLLDPFRLDAVVRAVAGSLTVDTGRLSLPDLVFALSGIRPDRVVGIRMPYELAEIDKLSYVLPTAESELLFTALRTDTLDSWARSNAAWINRI
jgi:LCP family protein required for cell wall assembly